MELSIKTATGKEFQVRFAGATSAGVTQVLYLEIIGLKLIELVPIFADPEETKHIQGLIDGEVSKEFKGYTNLIEAIVLAESGNVRIALAAPVDVLGE